ncbi:apotyrosinase chaperone MelC1 [Streptomyces sp. NRRL S-337]|uniref:apotyrosinase chaperone MelC1 n=1 Tax=Streptomyces sp. NRRL S-337 TaxID=1463900 RepID=UPI0004CB5C7D|nr:tyrosinase family oxidase copper chaperone [Streptomyces sp. NRRL S-337]
MSRPTRRQVLYGSAASLAGVVLAAPVAHAAHADRAVERSADGHGHPAAGGHSGSGHDMPEPEPFDEMYQGRHIAGWPADSGDSPGGQGGHGKRARRLAGPHDGMDFVVRIDNDDLHVMRNADGTWISLVNHYEKFSTPHALARAAVRVLQGADLVPVITG